MKSSIIILAAGLGTRMKSNTPKVLQKLSGQSMIWHILRVASKLSDDISVVLSHQKEVVESEIRSEFSNVKFLEQDLAKFPGTAGALKGFKSSNDRVLILCGDMPLIKLESLEKLLVSPADIALAVFDTKKPKSYGRVVISENKVEKIVELKDASEEERQICTCNAGVYAINSQILDELLPKINNQNASKEYYLTDIIALARAQNYSITPVFVDENEFMGVNDKFELSVADGLMQAEIKCNLMKNGVKMTNPQSIFIDAKAEFIGECELQENVCIQGACVISNSIIKSSSVIEESVVENSDVGPMAHLRPGCKLKNTHIGNFVECKKAVLDGVKAGHLSYLGDCEIGRGTNIGCGTITCNYDGVKKHKTIIGKNVFVGSDTQFVAPIRVADDAIIAAGSTVTQDINSGELFINRAPAKAVKDYFYKKFGVKNDEECES